MSSNVRALFLFMMAVLLVAGCDSTAPSFDDATSDPVYAEQTTPDQYARGASGKVRALARHLEVEILASNSDFINEIYLVWPRLGREFYIGPDEATGTVVALPPVRRNSELIFEIRVFEPDGKDTGLRWRTGPPSRNADRQRHAQVTYLPGREVHVDFEDLHADGWGAADEPNFVDALFVVRPVSP